MSIDGVRVLAIRTEAYRNCVRMPLRYFSKLECKPLESHIPDTDGNLGMTSEHFSMETIEFLRESPP